MATTTPDLTFPPTACLVQSNVGAKNANAFDMNAVCAGWLNALVTASQFLKAGSYRHALVIGADTLSRLVEYRAWPTPSRRY